MDLSPGLMNRVHKKDFSSALMTWQPEHDTSNACLASWAPLDCMTRRVTEWMNYISPPQQSTASKGSIVDDRDLQSKKGWHHRECTLNILLSS